jgi:hypothetical protein
MAECLVQRPPRSRPSSRMTCPRSDRKLAGQSVAMNTQSIITKRTSVVRRTPVSKGTDFTIPPRVRANQVVRGKVPATRLICSPIYPLLLVYSS